MIGLYILKALIYLGVCNYSSGFVRTFGRSQLNELAGNLNAILIKAAPHISILSIYVSIIALPNAFEIVSAYGKLVQRFEPLNIPANTSETSD